MFAPRSRIDENALAGQAQTPGPWLNRGPLGSPTKMNHPMTTGKQRKTAQEEGGSGSPKKLFQNMKSPMKSATPGPGPSSRRMGGLAPKTPGGLRSALGDKTNNNKTPFQYHQRQPEAGKSSPTKSPTKRKAQGSPTKMRKEAAPPQTPAPAPQDGDASYVTMPSVRPTSPSSKTHAPQVFQTPAANVGRRGMMKQRLGEIQDAQRMASAGIDPDQPTGMENIEEQQHWADGLTEEELYPEIEYMPPPSSHVDVVDLHPELDGLPRAGELAAALARPDFTARGWNAPPAPLPEPPRTPSIAETLADEMREIRRQVQEDTGNVSDEDEPWPDVRVPIKASMGARQQPVAPATRSAPPQNVRRAPGHSSLRTAEQARAQRQQSSRTGTASASVTGHRRPAASASASGRTVSREVPSVRVSTSGSSLSRGVTRAAGPSSSSSVRRVAAGPTSRVQTLKPSAGTPASSRAGSGESTSTWSTISGTSAASMRSTPTSRAGSSVPSRPTSRPASQTAPQVRQTQRPRAVAGGAGPGIPTSNAKYTTRRHLALCNFDQEDEAAKFAKEMAGTTDTLDQDFALQLTLDLDTQEAQPRAEAVDEQSAAAEAAPSTPDHGGDSNGVVAPDASAEETDAIEEDKGTPEAEEDAHEEENDDAETTLRAIEMPAAPADSPQQSPTALPETAAEEASSLPPAEGPSPAEEQKGVEGGPVESADAPNNVPPATQEREQEQPEGAEL